MNCRACGYNKEKFEDTRRAVKEAGLHMGAMDDPLPEWIELAIVERGPFFAGLPYQFDRTSAGSIPDGVTGVPMGQPAQVLACPQCGTLKIEVKP